MRQGTAREGERCRASSDIPRRSGGRTTPRKRSKNSARSGAKQIASGWDFLPKITRLPPTQTEPLFDRVERCFAFERYAKYALAAGVGLAYLCVHATRKNIAKRRGEVVHGRPLSHPVAFLWCPCGHRLAASCQTSRSRAQCRCLRDVLVGTGADRALGQFTRRCSDGPFPTLRLAGGKRRCSVESRLSFAAGACTALLFPQFLSSPALVSPVRFAVIIKTIGVGRGSSEPPFVECV